MIAAKTSLPFATDERGAGRFSRGQTAAIGFSLAVHLAIGGYLAYQKWTPAIEKAFEDTPPIVVDTLKPEPPKPAPDAPMKPSIRPRVALPTPFTPPDVIPIDPMPADLDITGTMPTTFTPSTSDAGTAVVPTPPKVAVISNPNWIKKPGPRQFERVFPESAIRKGI
ncbi:MAG TPA: hypothetical protein VF122_05020, partial [Caulobacteraceae bacterium]